MSPPTWASTRCGRRSIYPFETPRTFITSGGLGTMGFGMGAAIGACIGTGKKTVLVTSDGSFHMNMNELATAVTNRLPLIVIVLNNGVLGMVRQWQTMFYDQRYSQTTLDRKTDYVQAGGGLRREGASRDRNLDELDTVLDEAFALDGPVVVDIRDRPRRDGAADDPAQRDHQRYDREGVTA